MCHAQNFLTLLVQLLTQSPEQDKHSGDGDDDDSDEDSDSDAAADQMDKLRVLLEMMMLYSQTLFTRHSFLFPQDEGHSCDHDEGEREREGSDGYGLRLHTDTLTSLCSVLLTPPSTTTTTTTTTPSSLPTPLLSKYLDLLTLLSAADSRNRLHLQTGLARDRLEALCQADDNIDSDSNSDDVSFKFNVMYFLRMSF
jgi:hypothetical protein